MNSKILGPEVGYVDLLDHQTYEASKLEEEEYANGAPQPYNPLRPSSAGKCTRELAYSLMEWNGQSYTPKEIREPNTTRLLSLGHAMEPHISGMFQKYTKDYLKVRFQQQGIYAFDVTSEKVPEFNHLVEGSLDECFWSPEHRAIIDYKTKKDKFHRFYKTDWDATTDKLSNMESVEPIEGSSVSFWVDDLEAFLDELKDPFFEANFWQLNLYANTDWAKKMKIDHACIIQYNKNDSRMREVRFRPSDALYQRTHSKYQTAVDAASKGNAELAPRDHMFGSIKCAFCPFKNQCWSEKKQDAKKAFFETFPNKKWPKDVERLNKHLANNFESLYDEYLSNNEALEVAKGSEEAILKLMADNDLWKIRFEDGKIYERKLLKSPRPHYELRRSKL